MNKKLNSPTMGLEEKKKNSILDIIMKYYSVALIIGVILFAALVMFFCKKGVTTPEVTITNDIGEVKYYNKDYEGAITEFEKLNKENEWPLYIVKEAEAYSAKGDFKISNRLLNDAYMKRNQLIDKEGKVKYKDKDPELANYIVYVSFLNGDYVKAKEYAEVFLKEGVESSELLRTLFAVDLFSDNINGAKDVLKMYPVDISSSYDLSLYAKMNFIVGNFNEGFVALKDAWYQNKDEIKIFETIEEAYLYNDNKIISSLENLAKDNEEEVAYKVFLAKYYSLSKDTVNKARDIVKSIENIVNNNLFKTINYRIEKFNGNKDEANDILEEIAKDSGDTYLGHLLLSTYYYESANYSKAMNEAKLSILADNRYAETYGLLIPSIMMKNKQSELVEPYFLTALRKEPFNYEVLLKAGQYYSKIEANKEKAFTYYKLASKISSKNPEILYDMALVSVDKYDSKMAIELLKTAIQLNNKEIKYHRVLGVIYYNSGKEDLAIKEFREAYNLDNNDIITLNNAGCYYIEKGDEIERGIANLKAASQKVNGTTDSEIGITISDNYEKAKTFKMDKASNSKVSPPDLQMILK